MEASLQHRSEKMDSSELTCGAPGSKGAKVPCSNILTFMRPLGSTRGDLESVMPF